MGGEGGRVLGRKEFSFPSGTCRSWAGLVGLDDSLVWGVVGERTERRKKRKEKRGRKRKEEEGQVDRERQDGLPHICSLR